MQTQDFIVTATVKALVARLGKLGILNSQIALLLHIEPETLLDLFANDLQQARLQADVEVIESLYDMATSRRHLSATIFWAKIRCNYVPGFDPNDIDPRPAKKDHPSGPRPFEFHVVVDNDRPNDGL